MGRNKQTDNRRHRTPTRRLSRSSVLISYPRSPLCARRSVHSSMPLPSHTHALRCKFNLVKLFRNLHICESTRAALSSSAASLPSHPQPLRVVASLSPSLKPSRSCTSGLHASRCRPSRSTRPAASGHLAKCPGEISSACSMPSLRHMHLVPPLCLPKVHFDSDSDSSSP
jgi:hypothetical protein